MKNNMKCKIKRNKNAENKFRFVLHPVTILLAIASIFVGYFFIFFAYLFALLLHEFSHMIVAKKLNYYCSKIVLYPSGALLFGDTDEFTFKDEILISLAGPAANILVCILFVFLWWICPEIYNFSGEFVVANVSIAFFNLLPIYPLDGGRIVLAMLSLTLPRKQASHVAKNITIIVSVVMFIWFVVSLFFVPNFQIGLTSIIIFISVLSEQKDAAYKRLIKSDLKKRKLKHGLKVSVLMIEDKTKLSKVLGKIDNFAFYYFWVVDDNFNILAKLSEQQIYEVAKVTNLSLTMAEVIDNKN